MMLVEATTSTPAYGSRSRSVRPPRSHTHPSARSSARPMSRPTGGGRLRRPVPGRPGSAGVAYRGTGVKVSRAPHGARPVSVAITALLAGLAALTTVWLGLMGLDRGAASAATVPDRLAVVQVQPGESLQRLAARVAPDAPSGEVVEIIKSLNGLESAALSAGQTLIAPIG